jgi:RimJ/RimL family protein N-acetyltransferase
MVLGMLYLYWPDRADASTVEIAFWIRASAQGRGLARQAVRIVADWLFAETSASQLRLHISERNVRSQHVARACGFQMQRQCAGVRRYALLA